LQIEELQESTVPDIEDELENLPIDLDGTYDKIVAKINPEHRATVHNILQWLSFAFEPLMLNQVAQVVGVIPDRMDGLRFESSRVYPDPVLVLRVCSGLVTLVNGILQSPCHFSSTDEGNRNCQALSYVGQRLPIDPRPGTSAGD
jgi:hypothetical protein